MTEKRPGGENTDAKFVEQVSVRLEQEIEDLPDTTVRRLQQIRRQALANADKRPDRIGNLRVPALIASAAVVALAVAVNFSIDAPIPELPVASEAEFVLAQEMDLLQQLEFLAWLEEEQSNAG